MNGHERFNEAAGIPRGRPTPYPPGQPCLEGFNEAAGIPRGRPIQEHTRRRLLVASMRPRVFPAEDGRSPASTAPACPCFNEAAGIPRGRRKTWRG